MLLSVVIQAIDKTASAFDSASARIGKVETHLKDVGTAQDGFNKSWERTRGVLNTAANAAGIAGAMIVGSLGAVAGIAIRAGADIAESATKMGLSVEEYTKLKFAAEQSGTSVQTLAMCMGRLSRAAQEANQNGGASADAFKALGVEVTDASGQLKGQHELLLETADAMSKIENPTQRSALAMQLMGRGGRELLPMLMEGAEGIQRMEEQAKKLGLVLTGDTAKSLDAAADKIDGAKSSLQMTAIVVGSVLVPALATAATAVAQVIVPFRNWAEENPDLAAGLLAVAGAVGVALLAAAALTKAVLFLTASKEALAVVTALVEKSELTAAAAAAWATVANTALGRSLAGVAVAASTAWKAILGPIGWVIAALGLVGGIVLSISRHYRAKAAAANEAATADKGVAAAATEATDAQEEEAKKVRDAAKAYADAMKEKANAERDLQRVQRDTARAVRDAQEAVQDAYKAQADAARDGADAIADAERAATQAREDAARAAQKAARSIEDAKRDLVSAEQDAADRIADAERRVQDAKRKTEDAERDLQRAMSEGAESVQEAQERGQKRIADAEKRLADAKRRAAGIEETEEERNARMVREAEEALAEARKESAEGVAEAQEQAAERVADAVQRVADAQQAVRDAEAEVQKARAEGAERIRQAEVALSDARTAAAEATKAAADKITQADEALAKARQDANDRLASAERALRNAQEGYGKAVEDAADRVAAAIERVTKALEDLDEKRVEAQKIGAITDTGAETMKAAPVSPQQEQYLRNRAARTGQSWWQRMFGAERAGEPEKLRFRGHRASGGPVSAGQAYLVGERGPELFVPRSGGGIVPNGMMAAAAGGPVEVHVRLDVGLDDSLLVRNGARIVEGREGRDAIIRLIESRFTRKGV